MQIGARREGRVGGEGEREVGELGAVEKSSSASTTLSEEEEKTSNVGGGSRPLLSGGAEVSLGLGDWSAKSSKSTWEGGEGRRGEEWTSLLIIRASCRSLSTSN